MLDTYEILSRMENKVCESIVHCLFQSKKLEISWIVNSKQTERAFLQAMFK